MHPLPIFSAATTSVKNTQSLLSRKKYPINKDRVKHQIAAIKEILGVSPRRLSQIELGHVSPFITDGSIIPSMADCNLFYR